MLNLLSTTVIVVISSGHMDYPKSIVLNHEYGHVNCPWWHHGDHDMKAIIPPKQCQGKPRQKIILEEWDSSTVHSICGAGHDACTVR